MPRPVINRYFIARQQKAKPKRTALWTAMRVLREFSARDLMAVCETDNRRSVLTYLSYLRRAGFVRIARAGNGGKHEPRVFRIVRNTGPKAPAVIARRNSLFDPNTDLEYSLEQQ